MSGADAEPPGTAIVHLLGHVGVGKYTVGTELVRLAAARGAEFALVDNHLTANVVFSVLPVDPVGDQELPAEVWERVFQVREVLLRTIEQLSPPAWSFVFTNVALEGHPVNSRSVQRVRALAAARRSHYVPVRLHCERDEHLRRVARPERAARGKLLDPERVGRQADSYDLVHVEDASALDLDITNRSATETATVIMAHVDEVTRQPNDPA